MSDGLLRRVLSERFAPVASTLDDLRRLALHPRTAWIEARRSAEILGELLKGGIVVSTAPPTPEQVALVKRSTAPIEEVEGEPAMPAAVAHALADANARGAAAGEKEPLALRTLLQVDGDVVLKIDGGIAGGDQRVLTALVQVHLDAVRGALEPLRRAERNALALRSSAFAAAPLLGLASVSVADWIIGMAVATAAGGALGSSRWLFARYVRWKAGKMVAEWA